jgi:putative endonuclease
VSGYRSERGRAAEDLACDHLEGLGYRVVTRNHRCPQGELDIVAWDGPVLCFVEVRARAPGPFGTALETIGPRKIRRVVAAARDYLETLPPPWPEMRFDAVGIELTDPPEITLVRAAFEA